MYEDCSVLCLFFFFFFSSRRRHTRFDCDWSSDVCSSDLVVRDLDDDLGSHADGIAVVRRRQRPQTGGHRGELSIDRKSTRLNSSHSQISYAVFCLKKKIRWWIQKVSRRPALAQPP